MPVKTLAGCAVLVVTEQPFSAHCLRVLLESAGAEVHAAAHAGEALYCIDRERLSAAVLHLGATAKGGRQVVQRLARLKLPYVMCKDGTDRVELPGASVLIKPIMGGELVDTLARLIGASRRLAPSAAGDVARRSDLGKGSDHGRFAERQTGEST
jgi:DNA-binding response OmpR family regulator